MNEVKYVEDFYNKFPPIYNEPLDPEINEGRVKTFKEDHESLIRLIETHHCRNIFEIGTSRGYTTKLMADHPIVQKIVSIDPWESKRRGDQVAGNPKVTAVKDSSFRFDITNFIKESCHSIDMVFIDGDHDLHSVLNDTKIALLMRPRIIVWHDWIGPPDLPFCPEWTGVRQAAQFYANKEFGYGFKIIPIPLIMAYTQLRE